MEKEFKVIIRMTRKDLNLVALLMGIAITDKDWEKIKEKEIDITEIFNTEDEDVQMLKATLAINAFGKEVLQK